MYSLNLLVQLGFYLILISLDITREMYSVVEFSESHGGGMGIVRDQWLTPRKQECFWPPFKIAAKYNKCLLNPEPPNENWPLYTIKRTFYSTGQYTNVGF